MQQQIKNILNTQIDSLLVRAKEEIRNEGRKKISDLQNQVPTPDDIIKKLQADTNSETCSDRGKEKQRKKYDTLKEKLDKIHNTVKSALEKINDIEQNIKPIAEEKGPLSSILDFIGLMKDILLPILKIVILAAPVLLAANSGPTSSGAVTDAVSSKREKAKSKVAEYSALIASIPLMIAFYKKQAEKIYKPLEKLKNKLKRLDDILTKLKLFMFAQILQSEDQCDKLENAANSSNDLIIPDPTGPTELEEYMSFLNDHYKDVYDKLQTSGNNKATKRIFTLKENLEEDYNISFKTINF